MILQAFRELARYVMLGEGLAYFHRTPLDPNYREKIETLIRNREANFLKMAQAILRDPAHPYSQLFAIAGCTYADLEADVSRNGLESTLEALLREGVYLTLDEFRCRTEIVRGTRHITATMADWDRREGQGPLQMISSGSSGGRSLRTRYSIESARLGLAGALLMRDEFADGRPAETVMILPILPSTIGLSACAACHRLGSPTSAWFAIGGPLRRSAHYRALTAALVTRLRLAGARVPHPAYLQENDFSPVAEFVAGRKRQGARVAMHGMVSSITRVAGAALDRGLDIRGSWAFVVGESLTDLKRDLIESAGIRVYPTYGTSDFGGIGGPCSQMTSGNCVHISRGSVALIGRPIENIWGDGEPVNSLHLTGLLPFHPRFLINVEIGDTGIIEPATCDCTYSRIGYVQQVREIAAISKICGQGSTLYARDIVQVLEEGLPARFGGRPGDYQLIEVEGVAQTDLELRVHPRLAIASPQAVLESFLAQCRNTYGGALAVRLWTESRGIRVETKSPVLASSGKFRALRLLGPGVGVSGSQASDRVSAASREVEHGAVR